MWTKNHTDNSSKPMDHDWTRPWHCSFRGKCMYSVCKVSKCKMMKPFGYTVLHLTM